MAHTVMSWAFDDGQHLAISIETRKEEGESYSAILGFFHKGWIDEMAYSRRTIDTSMPFSELRRRSAITAKAQAIPAGMNFSEWVRRDLPEGV